MTDALKALPDYPALEQLARALWRDGTVRGAAVLVGAGFSRNANRPAADTPIPPLWNDLVKDLIAQLYPTPPTMRPMVHCGSRRSTVLSLGRLRLMTLFGRAFPTGLGCPAGCMTIC